VEPREDRVGINAVFNVGQKVPKDQSLFARSMRRRPKPSFTQVIVNEEDVALFEPDQRILLYFSQ